jgi:hypothetical protein
VIEGNTFREILVGPVLVLLWACAVYFIDRWALKGTNQAASVRDCANPR